MADNFRTLTKTLSNPRVIDSYSGNDTTGDGTFDTPYVSIARALVDGGTSVNFILGSGTYTEVTNLSIVGSGGHTLQGEKGLEKSTIWNLNGGTITLVTNNGWTNIKNLTITNGIIIMTSSGVDINISNVIFKDIELRETSSLTYVNFTDCEFINVIGFQTNIHRSRLTRCKLINTSFYNGNASPVGYGVFKLESCDVDSFSNVRFTTEAVLIANGKVDYNNIRGNLMFQNGTNPNVYVDLATALIEHPTAMGTNNINSDPLYWDVTKLVLNVHSNSPNLGTGKSGVNIGNVKKAITKFCDIDPELNGTTGTAVISNLIGTSDKVVDPLQSTGYIETGVIVINSVEPQIIESIDYVGLIANDFVNGISQLPNATDSPLGQGAENLDVMAMWHNGLTPPTATIDSTFDNGGILPAGTWSKFEWNTKPLLDAIYRGNGDPDYDDSSTTNGVGAKWIKFRVVLKRV